MNTVLPVEQPFWFSITMRADARLVPVLRDLSVRLARQVGCQGDDADCFGSTLVDAVAQAIERSRTGEGMAGVEAVFRVSLSAFEVTLVLRGYDDRGAAALASLD